MRLIYTEASYENSIIELFQNKLGYEYAYGPDIERDFYSPLYEDVLLESLYRLNRGLQDDAIHEALYKLKNFENGELVQKNAIFMDYLQNGIPVRYFVGGEERSSIVYLVDYKNPDNNSFIVANQWTFIENSNKRPDVILFLNGLPVVLVELKSPSREETDASEAYRQLRNYMQEIPSMFIYNAICVMSDQKMDIKANFAVENKLGLGSDEINVELKISNMKDFSPDNIAKQIPEINQLLELRKALVSLKGPMGNIPDFRKAVLDALKNKKTKQELLLEIKDSQDVK